LNAGNTSCNGKLALRALMISRGARALRPDLSIAKHVAFTQSTTLQFRAEFFNVFNRVNVNLPNTNFLSGEFGQITSAGDPRRVQLGVKLYF
jgi:hypothetical protein